eukprot:jgi/Botrbrau1/10121/Bobra.20_2s0027.1
MWLEHVVGVDMYWDCHSMTEFLLLSSPKASLYEYWGPIHVGSKIGSCTGVHVYDFVGVLARGVGSGKPQQRTAEFLLGMGGQECKCICGVTYACASVRAGVAAYI